MINVTINGDQQAFDHSITVSELLDILSIDLTQCKIAVEINTSICPRHRHSSTHIYDKDKIEIITAVGGG